MKPTLFTIPTRIEQVSTGLIHIVAEQARKDLIWNMLKLRAVNPGVVSYEGGKPTVIALTTNPGYDNPGNSLPYAVAVAAARLAYLEYNEWPVLFERTIVTIVGDQINLGSPVNEHQATEIVRLYLAWISTSKLRNRVVDLDSPMHAPQNIEALRQLVTEYEIQALNQSFDEMRVAYERARRQIN
jgi:HAMP domain-containing protein